MLKSEFDCLHKEKEKLQQAIKDSIAEQEVALKAQEAALEAHQTVLVQEQQLQQQMDLVDSCASEAIAMELSNIE